MSARDKLAELRRLATEATPGPWVHQQGQWAITAPEHDKEHGGCNVCGLHDGGQTWASAMANGDHIAAWSPDRALRFLALCGSVLDALDATRVLLVHEGGKVHWDGKSWVIDEKPLHALSAALAAALEE